MSEHEILEQRQAYSGKILDVALDRVRLPNGNVTQLEVIRHPGAAAVVPVTSRLEAVLVRQFRYATAGWLLEVPAGKLDPGESPEVCARREVAEETGFEPGELVPLGWIWTSPGFTDEKIWLYLATELRRTQQNLQGDEVLSVVRLPLDQAVAQSLSGEIQDAKSVCALLRAAQHLGLG